MRYAADNAALVERIISTTYKQECLNQKMLEGVSNFVNLSTIKETPCVEFMVFDNEVCSREAMKNIIATLHEC